MTTRVHTRIAAIFVVAALGGSQQSRPQAPPRAGQGRPAT
jgi:hypothetical protein